MKKMFLWSALSAVMILTACDKDDNDNNEVNTTDDMFMTQVNIGNRAEVMAGQLAASKGTSAEVKAFGQMMVTEHGLAQNELMNIAGGLGRNLPDTVDAEHRELMARLNALTGYEFDTAYMNSQVKDHQKTLNIFQMELSNGNNQSLRNYASKYLPHIQMHFQKADSIAQNL